MNVSFTFIKHFLISLLLLSAMSGYAQLEFYEVIADEGFEYEIHSSPNPLGPVSSSNGSVSITNLGSSNYRLNYTPDFNFLGLDTLDIQYWYQFQPSRKGIVLNVIPSKVTADNDYASTTVNTPVIIDVLANDWGNRDTLALSGIPLVNNGNAIPDGDKIVFIPDTDFEGIAHFNYIVCDDIGTCATGTVSVSVVGNGTPEPFDTTYLATAKNTILPIPLNFDNYTIFSTPSNGSSAFIAPNVIEYEPTSNYVGADQFTLKRVHNGVSYYKVFVIDVLTTQSPNGVAFDDYAYTPVNTPVEINVADNDLGNYNVISFTQSNDGLVEKIAGKVMRFTPNLNFEGIATFTYKINIGANTETATVYVNVDNQTPASSVFDLTTMKNVPKPIYYDIPIDQFSFSIADQADHGTVTFYEGYLDTIIYGQNIAGHNLVIYTPDVDFVGMDEFEVLYCVNTNNECQLTKINMNVQDLGIPSSELCISDECVWPGDGNNDGIVNMVDLLFLGYSFGEVGNARSNPSPSWYGQFSAEWGKSAFPGAVDTKYTDMNGDGVIADTDLTSMSSCYNLTHSLTPEYNTFAKNYPYYFIATDTTVNTGPQGGHFVEYDIVLGNSFDPIIDLTGITFSFDFNPIHIDANSVEVTFDAQNWFNFNSPSLDLVKKPWIGRVDAGYTRTSGQGVSGHGKVGKLKILSFIVDDDIILKEYRLAGLYNTIRVSNVMGLDSEGRYIQLPDSFIEVPVLTDEEADENSAPVKVAVFPNPTSDILNLQANDNIQYYQIYSITGKALYNSGNISSIATQMDLSRFVSGTYIVRIQTESGVATEKIQLTK